jgi:hypothetical protein
VTILGHRDCVSRYKHVGRLGDVHESADECAPGAEAKGSALDIPLARGTKERRSSRPGQARTRWRAPLTWARAACVSEEGVIGSHAAT